MPETPIPFDDVEVVAATDMTLRVRIQGRELVIGRGQVLLDGTTVRVPGDRGRLVLPRWAVQDLGLREPPA